MGRKCSKCDIEGHTARNCPSTEEERLAAKLPVPTKIHITMEAKLCAQTLPVCEECAVLYQELTGRPIDWPRVPLETNSNSEA